MFNFSIESQVLYHAPLSFEPSYMSIGDHAGAAEDRIGAAVEKASHGDAEAEQVAEALVQQDSTEKAYVIGEEEMKVFVNSERWTLGKSAVPVVRASAWGRHI